MNQFKDIQKAVQHHIASKFDVEEVLLPGSFNRVLQQDIVGDMDMPPFDKSAMDGYACRIKDLGNAMEVLETIPAGVLPTKKIGCNQCSKIMTGAMVPDGADCVFMVEDAELIDNKTVRCNRPGSKRNVSHKGEDYKAGECLIDKGTIINTSHIAVMAGAGYNKVMVSKPLRIGLLTTGSELVEPNERPPRGKIRNSNASQLLIQLNKMGLPATYYGLCKDDYHAIQSSFQKVINENDVIIITGGASMGDFDFVPAVLKAEKFNILWDRTGLKPGNPMTFAVKENKYSFGLSGNPVSSLVQFDFIVKPILYKVLGAHYKPLRIKAIMGTDMKRGKGSRFVIKPVIINEDGVVEGLPFNGSAHINALTKANALLEMPEGMEIKKGERVHVRPL